jgi:hypothetical protein
LRDPVNPARGGFVARIPLVTRDQIVEREKSAYDAPVYDCGDHLYPSDLGYRAMGDAIDLSLFD